MKSIGKSPGLFHYLWRAVDQDGHVLDILVQNHRHKKAAKTFFRKLLRVIITDKLKNYGAAKREIFSGVEHPQHRYRNNRTKSSQQQTRQREWQMPGFKSRIAKIFEHPICNFQCHPPMFHCGRPASSTPH
jgi:putative transposase